MPQSITATVWVSIFSDFALPLPNVDYLFIGWQLVVAVPSQRRKMKEISGTGQSHKWIQFVLFSFIDLAVEPAKMETFFDQFGLQVINTY